MEYYSMLTLLLICLFINIYPSFGADSILANQSLSGNNTIISSGGNYELGFFKPSSSSKYFIGIWFKKVPEQTVVWVANRAKPVRNKYTSELKVVDGNLVLLDEMKTQVWSTKTEFTSYTLVAVLFDDGNLVLRNESCSALITHLTPGCQNSEDPAPGLFILEVDPINNEGVIMWNRSKQIWKSGPWDGQAFGLVPNVRHNSYSLFNFTYITNENETSLSYNVIQTPHCISRTIIDFLGSYSYFHGWEKTISGS
ncbi:G-type lectin S-receptor-like serine/threonine-protein kinase At2g19130 [Apium graveolens]|uniref:G-type lectin S-receptor-like serine/threonine-protein kinase At2g19130 n=1 Tax=Apium graveolens TaxID=4045 RepID=UPI003D7B039B